MKLLREKSLTLRGEIGYCHLRLSGCPFCPFLCARIKIPTKGLKLRKPLYHLLGLMKVAGESPTQKKKFMPIGERNK